MRESWLQLKRLLGISPATPTYEQEGQLRYVRDDGTLGVLYLARGADDDTTYAWVPVVMGSGDAGVGSASTDVITLTGRILTDGGEPSVVPNAVNTTGAGVGATATITGNNQSGSISIDPAGTPGAGTQATITFFGIDRGSTPYGIWLAPNDTDAHADHTKVRGVRSSGTQWLLIANAALNLNSHQWKYWIVEGL